MTIEVIAEDFLATIPTIHHVVDRARVLHTELASHGKRLNLAKELSISLTDPFLGDVYRRWKARLGGPKAITAMAHKLARVLWHLLKFKQPFDWTAYARQEPKMKQKKLARLQNLAASLNYQLTPLP